MATSRQTAEAGGIKTNLDEMIKDFMENPNRECPKDFLVGRLSIFLRDVVRDDFYEIIRSGICDNDPDSPKERMDELRHSINGELSTPCEVAKRLVSVSRRENVRQPLFDLAALADTKPKSYDSTQYCIIKAENGSVLVFNGTQHIMKDNKGTRILFKLIENQGNDVDIWELDGPRSTPSSEDEVRDKEQAAEFRNAQAAFQRQKERESKPTKTISKDAIVDQETIKDVKRKISELKATIASKETSDPVRKHAQDELKQCMKALRSYENIYGKTRKKNNDAENGAVKRVRQALITVFDSLPNDVRAHFKESCKPTRYSPNPPIQWAIKNHTAKPL